MRSTRWVRLLVATVATAALWAGSASAANAAVSSATDSFSRTVVTGLGSADTGGAWSLAGASSRFSVASGAGRLATPAGTQLSGSLPGVAIRDTDVVATVTASALPAGGSLYIGVLARHTGSLDYAGRVIVSATGAVRINLMAGPTSLVSSAVPALAVAPGAAVRIRLQAVGTAPTTLRARVWPVGGAEPTTWQATATDSTPGLQGAGSPGLTSYVSSGATNGPVTAVFDDLVATSIGAVNLPPSAAFTTSVSGLGVAVDGSASSDPDGTIASYTWSFGDGGTATGRTASHTYSAPGAYTVTLTVTDDLGASGAAGNGIQVTMQNLLPTAAFTVTTNDLTVTVDGSASSDPDGTVVASAWTFGDGSSASGPTATHTYAVAGTYSITVTVTDDGGGTGSSARPVTVRAANVLPVPTLLEQSTALTATFWGDRSTDVDGSVTGYAWTFGDGSTASGASVDHVYSAPGSYPVTLTVTDDRGGTAVAARTVGVYATGVRPTQSQWLGDVDGAIAGGSAVLDAGAAVTKPAIVLDIDNTALQSSYQPFAANPSVLAFEQRAIADGYTVLFATGRTVDTGGTAKQLRAAGYRVDALCFKDPTVTTQASKTACRAGWAAQGYTVVANVGNHTTDLDGGNSGRQYLLPNYGFLD